MSVKDVHGVNTLKGSIFFNIIFLVDYQLTLVSCSVDVPGGHELSSYYGRDDDRGAHCVVRDADSIGASYDRYLHGAVVTFYSCL